MIEARIILLDAYLPKREPESEKSTSSVSHSTEMADILGQAFYGTKLKKHAIKPRNPKDYIKIYRWTYKEKNPFLRGDGEWEKLANSPTVAVTATGKELTLIRTHFQNVPWVINETGVCEWIGEMAKFIAINFHFENE